MKGYVSEATNFIRDFLDKHPEVVEKQKKHRATWWDRPQKLADNEALEASKVPKKPYEYY
jgi:hypothetical protein